MKHSQIMGIITLTLILGISIIPTVDAKEKKHHVIKISQNKTKKHNTKKPLRPVVYKKNINHKILSSNHMIGIASFYGYESGPRTANGDKFDPHKMTAAHRTLPFGTIVKVVNLENNKSVLVKITDRGPSIRSRIIDLSKYAAIAIGLKGIGKVSLTIV